MSKLSNDEFMAMACRRSATTSAITCIELLSSCAQDKPELAASLDVVAAWVAAQSAPSPARVRRDAAQDNQDSGLAWVSLALAKVGGIHAGAGGVHTWLTVAEGLAYASDGQRIHVAPAEGYAAGTYRMLGGRLTLVFGATYAVYTDPLDRDTSYDRCPRASRRAYASVLESAATGGTTYQLSGIQAGAAVSGLVELSLIETGKDVGYVNADYWRDATTGLAPHSFVTLHTETNRDGRTRLVKIRLDSNDLSRRVAVISTTPCNNYA